jgi:hypothetical protein
MRGLRSTIALIVVLGGLGAYIYFVTWKKTDKDADAKEKVFASLQKDKIDEIRVRPATGDATTLKKENGVWQIVAPIAARADETEVLRITSNLGLADVTRVIDDNPADLKDYGLTTPRIAIEFKVATDKDFQKLLIGEKSPTGSDVFAKRNDEKRVFLIPAYEETALNRSTFDFRDKSLLKFERDKVDVVEVTFGGKTTQLAKEGPDWSITRPMEAKADPAAVDALIGRLGAAQMKSIVASDASAAELKKYGLDTPALAVTLNAGSSRATLMIGGKTADNTFYARDASKPLVATVDSALVDELKKGADQYRRKDLFAFRSYTANRLEITRDGQTFVFEMTKGQGDVVGKWQRVSPTPGDVDKEKFNTLLSRLSSMRAIAFPEPKARTGLDKPVMTVSVKFEDTKEERAIFGKVGEDVYAGHPGEKGAVQASMADFNEVTKALDEVSK